MMRFNGLFGAFIFVLLVLIHPVFAGSDQYLGDANIYAGVPTTLTNPNILIIIDNSRATLHSAAGQPFKPWIVDQETGEIIGPNIYPQKGGCTIDAFGDPVWSIDPDDSEVTWTEDARNGCYLPWNVYEQDNQGDFAKVTFENVTYELENLSCDPSGDSSNPIQTIFQNYGSYSGSGVDPYPNLDGNGDCDWKNNNSSGKVFALGNYLNYTRNAEGDDRIGAPGPDDEVLDPDDPCFDVPPPDTVRISTTADECVRWHPTNGSCQKEESVTRTTFYEVRESHTSSEDNHPVTGGDLSGDYWRQILESADADDWAPNVYYDAHICGDPDGGDDGITGATQRELIYNALEKVIGATAGVVHFAAMSYGGNNSGGKLLYPMSDLSYNTALLNNAQGIPVCPEDSDIPVCKFLKAIPGPGEADGEPVLSSNTLRPQAESVLDAGYYYGAIYPYITNTERIPEDMENICDLNHIILLTNGFSNGDGSPKLSFVGDADGDEYENENVYGLGSHWLDDVAKYLNENYKIKTHTVLAFQTEDDLVKNAASDGGGEFYNVYNGNQLSAALLDLLSKIINPASTSFVAPVVPASTTNRTISSDKVYLGLFRPQESGPWRGNIKKYGLDLKNSRLTDQVHTVAAPAYATDPYGNFYDYSISYWSLDSSTNLIPAAINDSGYIDPGTDNTKDPPGDGGEVDAGGAGGVLLTKMRNLAAAVNSELSWEPVGAEWRNIFTYLGSDTELWHESNRFMTSNGNITSLTLQLYDDSVEPPVLKPNSAKDNVVRFVHGFTDEDDATLPVSTANATVRPWILGDVLHSKPLVFNYSKYTSAYENTCYHAGTPTVPDTSYDPTALANSSVVFVGANDGMLHAFRDCDGEEIWAFLPEEALPSIKYFKDPVSGGHPTFVDSAPSLLVLDENQDGIIDTPTDKVVLVFGQRRGGGTNTLDSDSSRGSYYALDVSNPYAPKFLWSVNSETSQADELGETWSQPRLAKVKVDDSNFKVVAFVGAGYDNNEDLRFGNTQSFPDSSNDGSDNPVDINDASAGGTVDGSGPPLVSAEIYTASERKAPRGRGLMAIEVASFTRSEGDLHYTPTISGGDIGSVYWRYTSDSNNGDDPDFSFASDLSVLDTDGDTFVDTIYTGDTGGNLWRFRIGSDVNGDGTDEGKNEWSGKIIFRSNPGEDNSNGRKIFYKPVIANVGAPHIYFGTGDREHPLNISTEDRMYCVIDWGFNRTLAGSPYPLDENDLEDVTLNTIQQYDTDAATVETLYDRLYSTPEAPYNDNGDYTFGWYIKLDGTDRDANGDPGEKVLADATVFNGRVYFSTYQLEIGPVSGCEGGNLGVSRLYELNYKTGEAVKNYDLTNDLTADQVWDGDGNALINERAIGGADGEILQRTDRVRILGEGIPSGIVTLIDASGRVTQLISSSDKVEATGLTDVKLISPVYWMQW